ncbi:MAG: hypothetical protein WKG03_00175 [Telluria sp.]
MNKTNSNVQTQKSQQAALVARITTLDSQMAECGYDQSHPWRLALANMFTDEADASSTGIDQVRKQTYEIESRIGNVAVLIEAIFDKIDGLICVSPKQHSAITAINTFANSAMESAQAIRAANEQILSLTGGVQ